MTQESAEPESMDESADHESIDESADHESGDGESGDGESGDGESGDGESGDGESSDGESGDGESSDGESNGESGEALKPESATLLRASTTVEGTVLATVTWVTSVTWVRSRRSIALGSSRLSPGPANANPLSPSAEAAATADTTFQSFGRFHWFLVCISAPFKASNKGDYATGP